jgi:hypothetical protein
MNFQMRHNIYEIETAEQFNVVSIAPQNILILPKS